MDQLSRLILGDRFWHNHAEPIEDVENTTLHDVIWRTLNVTDLPLSVFMTPEISVCVREDCMEPRAMDMDNEVALSDS